jgi:hypothetical protein
MDHPAQPESALRIEIAYVPHPMPKRLAIRNLGQLVRLDARDIAIRDDRPANDQLLTWYLVSRSQ